MNLAYLECAVKPGAVMGMHFIFAQVDYCFLFPYFPYHDFLKYNITLFCIVMILHIIPVLSLVALFMDMLVI